MQNHLEILKRASKFIVCPYCSKHYCLEDISIRNISGGQLVLQAICSRGHSPIITLFVTRMGNINIKSEKISPIVPDEVIVMHQNLKKFKGNFRQLFKND